MKKNEILGYFKTYNKSSKIDILAQLLEHNVISMEMMASAQKIVFNKRIRQKYINELSKSKNITSISFYEIFKINKSDFKYIFNTDSLVITRDELSLIIDELQLHLYPTIFENPDITILEKLITYISIYNDYIKENKVSGKNLFYAVKNKVLKSFVINGYLKSWAIEKKEINESYYALTFEVNGKEFYFHQPTAYQEYSDILNDELQNNEREYRRDKINDANIVIDNELINKLQTLWKFISIKTFI